MPKGKVGKDELLKAESRSYHAPGTCTFYGTANSQPDDAELMGLDIPNAAFINPGPPLRQALTRAAAHRLAELARTTASGRLAHVIDEKAIVNAMAGLLATGGSTNHFHPPAGDRPRCRNHD